MGQVGFSSRELDMGATRQAMEEAQEEEMLELEGKRKEELRQKVVGMAHQKPGEMAQLLRAWMLKKKASAT
jgi:flagellar biosynthesis/type III secretory pathway M-ring protein FliF/YscJ